MKLNGRRSLWRRFVFGVKPRNTLVRLVLLNGLALLLFQYLLVPIRIVGISMAPTYWDGDLNLVNRVVYAQRAPQRGDVVTIRVRSENVLYLKRIIGLPGETVAILDGGIYINGQPLQEKYTSTKVPWEVERLVLGADEYFVIGDNRTVSDFGSFERRDILGKVLF